MVKLHSADAILTVVAFCDKCEAHVTPQVSALQVSRAAWASGTYHERGAGNWHLELAQSLLLHDKAFVGQSSFNVKAECFTADHLKPLMFHTEVVVQGNPKIAATSAGSMDQLSAHMFAQQLSSLPRPSSSLLQC